MSNVNGLLPKSISCFDKLSMSGKVTGFQHITVRPEPVEGQKIGLGNSPSKPKVQTKPKIQISNEFQILKFFEI